MVCTAWTSPKPHSTQFGFSFGWFTERTGKTAGNMEQEESAAVVSSPSTTECETLVSEPDLKSSSVAEDDGGEKPIGESKPTLLDQDDIFRAIEVVERDSVALAESFTSLYDSLRLSLSEATSSSVDHMNCFGDAAGQIQERALDAASKGNRYINSCRRLNEEMKHIDGLAKQLKILRRNVDALDSAANRQLYLP